VSTWVGCCGDQGSDASDASDSVLEQLGSARLLDNDDRVFLCYSGGRREQPLLPTARGAGSCLIQTQL
jgi:hypothetical protein